MLPAVGVPVAVTGFGDFKKYPIGTVARVSGGPASGRELVWRGSDKPHSGASVWWWDGWADSIVGHTLTVISYPPVTVYEGSPPKSYKVYCSWLSGPWNEDPGSPTPDDAVRWWQKQMKPYMDMACYRPGGDSFQSSSLIDSAGKRVASLAEVYSRITSTPEKQPMKIEVFTTPAPKTPEPLRLKLEQDGDCVRVDAVDANGEIVQSLCTFTSDGSLTRHAFYGLEQLQRDANSRIRLTN